MSEHKYLAGEELHRHILDALCIRDVDVRAAYVNRICAKYESDVAAQAVTELDRMRKALAEIDKYLRNLRRVPEVMWNDAIDFISETVFLGLNPQPAQRGGEARKALEDAPHDRNCNGAFGRDPLYPCDCWKSRALNPQPAQQEKA